mgnify:CR=1 FL=1
MHEHLRLEMSRHTIAAVRKGMNFVGYRTWVTRRFVRKHSLYTFSKALKSGNTEIMVSILGHARNTSSFKHMISRIHEEHYENHPI